jgi:imidazole glycerol-phosphate synthase subunit HisH
MITIIDYGMGNVGSILNMFKKLKIVAEISANEQNIKNAKKLVLPGVGAFDSGMNKLEKNKLIDLLNEKVIVNSTPILGICLGAQLMCNKSEEGEKNGLGWLDIDVLKFNFNKIKGEKVPHMGWNTLSIQKTNPIMKGVNSEFRFYFTHSYYFHANNQTDVLSNTDYGMSFNSSFQKNNIFGVQFHPEKSHRFGLKIFENFSKI